MNPGTFLRLQRIDMRLTQREIADLVGVTVTHVGNVESGRSSMPLRWVLLFSSLFDVDADILSSFIEEAKVEDIREKLREHKALSPTEKLSIEKLKAVSQQRLTLEKEAREDYV